MQILALACEMLAAKGEGEMKSSQLELIECMCL